MKALFIIFGAIILLFVLYLLFLTQSTNLSSAKGYDKDFYYYFLKLKEANNNDSFLIITIDGTDDFIQFKNIDGEYEVDFPLVTERQKSKEPAIKKACDKLGLKLQENYSTDKKDKFLDIYLKISPNKLSDIVKNLFIEVFGTTSSTAYVFEWSELEIK